MRKITYEKALTLGTINGFLLFALILVITNNYPMPYIWFFGTAYIIVIFVIAFYFETNTKNQK